MKNAGVQIEYGKNYDGFWDGAMFVQQVIIDLLSFIVLLLTITKLKEKIMLDQPLVAPQDQSLASYQHPPPLGLHPPNCLRWGTGVVSRTFS